MEEKIGSNATTQPLARYNLRREIGRGGMSIVYEAQDRRTGQAVAVKMLTLPPSLAPEQEKDLIARFGREARTIARLSHPNIVSIYEVSERVGQHFLAMEYLCGQTLRERLSAEPMPPAQAYPILAQIAGALDAVHAAGIVHRDVKPSNVMLLPDGTAKLLDFGIARPNDETTITNAGVIIGSPAYMAPEQVKGETGTAASDVWALGVIAYEMLAGHPPFTGQTVAHVLYQVTRQSPAPTPGLPIAVQKVLRRALDKSPVRRFPTAGAFIEALRATQPSQPPQPRVSSHSPRPSFVFPRWGPGVAFLLLFVFAFSWTLWMRHHASGSERASAYTPTIQEWRVPAVSVPVVSVPVVRLSPYFAARTPFPRKARVAYRDHAFAHHSRTMAYVKRSVTFVVKSNKISKPRVVIAASKAESRSARTQYKTALVARQAPYAVSQRPLAQTKRPITLLKRARPIEIAAIPQTRVSQPKVIVQPSVQVYAPPLTDVPRSTPRGSENNYDPEAAARLRKFLWAQGE